MRVSSPFQPIQWQKILLLRCKTKINDFQDNKLNQKIDHVGSIKKAQFQKDIVLNQSSEKFREMESHQR